MIDHIRSWASHYTRQGRFTPVGIFFHWIMAALIVLQLGWGFWTDWMSAGGDKVRAYQVHSAAGLPVLILAMLRAGWRMLVPDPYNDADRLGWQTTVAHGAAYLFYLTFFTLPLSGWVMWSALAPPGPLEVGGILPWPQIPLDNLDTGTRVSILYLAEDVHRISIILLLVLIPAHAGAALKHHFWDRHDVLRGMLPDIPDWEDDRAASMRNRQVRDFPKEPGAG